MLRLIWRKCPSEFVMVEVSFQIRNARNRETVCKNDEKVVSSHMFLFLQAFGEIDKLKIMVNKSSGTCGGFIYIFFADYDSVDKIVRK